RNPMLDCVLHVLIPPVPLPAPTTHLPPVSTSMGLTPGERLTVRELLDGVFLNSGNDAAETLASALTSRSTFIAAMNSKAARLGLRGTHFINPSGLDAPAHYSSAYAVALSADFLESPYVAVVGIAVMPAINLPASTTQN